MKTIKNFDNFYKRFRAKLFRLEYLSHNDMVMGFHYGKWHFRLKVRLEEGFVYPGIKIPLEDFWDFVEHIEMWDKNIDDYIPQIYHRDEKKYIIRTIGAKQ